MLDAPPPNLPDKPGCYIFRDPKKKPLYVGKAKVLKNRIHSYFQARVQRKIARLLHAATEIEFVVTANEWEAFLLENNLIKQFRPHFNTLLKDDKTYPFVKITIRDRYPKAVFTRRPIKDGSAYYGPFVPGWQAKKTLRILQEYFKICTCKDPLDGSRPRPCLYYEMGQCFAPCVKDRVGVATYKRLVQEARLFLDGKTSAMKAELESRMKSASASLEFELAAHYRDLLAAADSLGGSQSVARPGSGHWECWALYGAGEAFVLQGFIVIDGKVVDRKHFRFTEVELPPDEFFLESLARLYANSPLLPDGVAVSAEFEGMDYLSRYLSEKKGRSVEVQMPKRGDRAALIKTLLENARIEYESEMDPSSLLAPLAKSLGLPAPPNRIECFDISHIHGEEKVASCVVWESGRMQRSEYRSYIVKSVEGVDDFASMAEVVSRRYSKRIEESEPLPDLVLVDGGIGQVNAAAKALAPIFHGPLHIAGLAKREELVYLHGDSQPVVFPRESPPLRLLQQIRDEAHRFAVTFHRRRRSKARKVSPLLDVPGIGPVTARKLLKTFLTTEAVLAAGDEALIKAVGRASVNKIKAWAASKAGNPG